ncbi:FliM/FliN family flagellar motor C-terminal domain-containing protein [Piscinibacter terrae]|uniref:FliM/FliN family flagellar motor switch protein n=1 Tax=Piscinibacter terrae TaxID=2496871 RepID=A0A3N7HZX2_9BURK|nr:FliM/FliN family flagellar motor switch protein [Albitalea terrae]RQP26671.1 FliM/FliN family flagellar motor switch protein [Albitalea terrae]
MSVRPFRLVPDTAISAIREAVAQCLAHWAGDWGATLDDIQADVHRFDGNDLAAPTDEWQPLHGGWMWKSSELPSHVASAMGLPAAPKTETPSMSAQAVAQAAADLGTRVAGLLRDLRDASSTVRPPSLSQAAQMPGHGIVHVTLRRGTGVLSLAADVTAFKAWIPQAIKSAPIRAEDLDAALRTQAATLEVVLGHTELSLADMMDLGAGDVLLLDRRIDQPLVLSAIDGQAELPVHLGRQGDHFAVQLMGHHHS